MPNWCSNRLTVHGPAEDVNSFQMQAGCHDPKEKTELCLQKLYPCPPTLLNRELRSGAEQDEFGKLNMEAALEKLFKEPDSIDADDWYSWKVRNWGTKWDVEAHIEGLRDFKNGNREVVYTFDSAWSPPILAFEHISEYWPTLTFKLTYNESGMGVKGSKVFHGDTA